MRDAVRGKMKSGHEVTAAEAGLRAWKGVTPFSTLGLVFTVISYATVNS